MCERHPPVVLSGVLAVCLLAATNGCSDSPNESVGADVAADGADVADSAGDAVVDPTAEEVLDLDAIDAEPDAAPTAPPYQREYPPAADFPAPDGLQWRRAIIHLHSIHSHDACDGEPRVDGEYNWDCLASLRAALCTDHIDVAYLTDHRDLMAETPFVDLLLHDPAADELVTEGETPIANRMTCPDGFVVTIAAGLEGSDRLMPLAFRGHLSDDFDTRNALLDRTDGEAIAAFRAGGAVIWGAHSEQASAEEVVARGLDGMEIYNLHANVDPDIREEYLGLEPLAGAADLLRFLMRRGSTPPDLALLSFQSPNQPALDYWAQALQEQPVVGSAGTDAHENVIDIELIDDERFDSYRRMMSWFSNYILAADDSIAAANEGLAAGNVFIAFDVLGSPAGFDCALSNDAGDRFEMGSTLDWTEGLRMDLVVPQIEAPWVDSVATRALWLRAVDGTWEVVEELDPGTSQVPIAEPGIYRVEVRLTPSHLAAYLEPELSHLAEAELVWIYGNAFRVQAPE